MFDEEGYRPSGPILVIAAPCFGSSVARHFLIFRQLIFGCGRNSRTVGKGPAAFGALRPNSG